MKYFIPIFFLSFFASCSTAMPKEDEVKEKVKLWYMQQSSITGKSPAVIEGITVLSVTKDAERKGVFNTVSVAAGTQPRMPSADSLPDLKFYDTVKMSLEWNGAKWVSVKE